MFGWGNMTFPPKVIPGPIDPPVTDNQPPEVTISWPHDGDFFKYGAAIDFRGNVHDPEEGNIYGSGMVWQIDNDIYYGQNLSLDDLSGGSHTVTLTGIDSLGAKTSVSITITILDP